jgi:HAD superfamily hydrolase (TIGR01662 family)
MLKGVVFDLGSTLIQFEGDWPQVLDQSLEKLVQALYDEGHQFEKQPFIKSYRDAMTRVHQEREIDHIERTTTALIQECLTNSGMAELGEEAMDRVLLKLYAISEAHWNPMPGHKAVLQELKDEGYRIGLISNAGDAGNVQRLIDKVAIRPYLDPILVSATEGIRKPDVRLFQKLLGVWDLPPSRVVMIGDSLRADILGAKRAGMHSIWLTAAADSLENRADAGVIVPEATAEQLTQVPTLIKRLNGKVRLA